MRERQILFSAPMVRAILEGRKTQTRRVVKPQPPAAHNLAGFTTYSTCAADEGKAVWGAGDVRTALVDAHRVACPYGQPGDRLWVRETWANLTSTHGQRWEKRNATTGLYERGTTPFIWYAADGDQPDVGDGQVNPERWRPSIHMPRWASRITLEVTGVRVERLQSISDADAVAEGVDPSPGMRGDDDLAIHRILATFPDLRLAPVARFVLLWDTINGAHAGANWNANPWVWVVEFRRVPQ